MKKRVETVKVDLIKETFKTDSSILAAYFFGSQIKGKSNKHSDVDIAILFDEEVEKEKYADKQILLAEYLRRRLNKEIDIVVLNNASLFLRYHILKEGIKIYEKPDRNEHNFEAQTIMQYLDFLPIKNRIENGMLTKIKGAWW